MAIPRRNFDLKTLAQCPGLRLWLAAAGFFFAVAGSLIAAEPASSSAPVPADASAKESAHLPGFSLFYSYHCSPANRPAVREYMDTVGAAQFEKWKAEGAIKDYMILFASYVGVNSVPWDMLIRIDFEHYPDTDRWVEIERNMPAGLSPKMVALASPDNLCFGTTLSAAGMRPSDAQKAVFDVAYYRFKVPLNVGKEFVQGYVLPQLENFMRAKVITGYGLYLNVYEGAAWSYMLLTEYADSPTMDARIANKTKIRGTLGAAWQTLNDMKKEHIRDEPFGFIAKRIVPTSGTPSPPSSSP
jgi:hypothetical protein